MELDAIDATPPSTRPQNEEYGDAIIHFAGLSFLGSYRVALLNLLLRHPYLRPPFKVLCHMVSLVAIPVLQTPLPRALLERAYS